MIVHVTAYGDLRRYLPPAGAKPQAERDGGARLALPEGATITQLLDTLKLPYHPAWLIGVNDAVVGIDHPLHDGDEIELMLPIGGG